MNRLITSGLSLGAWIWKHASAFIALVAVVGALWLGFRLGSGGVPSEARSVQNTHDHSAQATDDPQFYTCSMHPTVRLEDPDAKCPICFMDLIPVEGNAGGGGQ